MGGLSPWHLLILLAVLIILFGAKKLPDAARGIGRSLKILKAETKGLRDDEDESAGGSSDVAPEMKELPKSTSSAGADSDEKVAELQRQLDELKNQQKNAS